MFLSSRRLPPLLAALTAAAVLAGCSETVVDTTPKSPVFYNRIDSAGATVDPQAAASLISGYRMNKGLGTVTVDPLLNKMAADQARAMAKADKVNHDVGGSFQRRLAASGFDAGIAAENVGAGYRTLAEAFSGWRDSPHHNANMLKPGVTKIGIGTAYAPNSKYKVYWSLVLAKPYERPAVVGGGPLPADGSTVVSIGGAVINR
ncbi:CAP domain-containing protein [Kaistia nematophila]|uniref:CAP domain-containing protein n=1 Tax=Kaistia nematophila TaxID=2994654 RepID=A0A9X3IMC8_9HYPH|nr:CAP domain-containing protein [Kaistia nematophila]MCX5571428.1 CAP domain-containing protein [Kaistia nematophila]